MSRKQHGHIVTQGGAIITATPGAVKNVVSVSHNATPGEQALAMARLRWPTPETLNIPTTVPPWLGEILAARYATGKLVEVGKRERGLVAEVYNENRYHSLKGWDAVEYVLSHLPTPLNDVDTPAHPEPWVKDVAHYLNHWLAIANGGGSNNQNEKEHRNKTIQGAVDSFAQYIKKEGKERRAGAEGNKSIQQAQEAAGLGDDKGSPPNPEGEVQNPNTQPGNNSKDSFDKDEVIQALAAAGGNFNPKELADHFPNWDKPHTIPAWLTDTGEWGPMTIQVPPRPRTLPGWMFSRALGPQAAGSIVRHIHRWPTDRAIFATHRRRYKPASILIDQSGSMSLSDHQVDALLAFAPRALIAQYCGDGHKGWLTILANKGRRIEHNPSAYRYDSENTVDYPALVWLSKQPGPRIWCSDGQVVGKNKARTMKMYAQVSRICVQAGIKRLSHPASVIAWLRKAYGRTGAY